MKKFLPILAVFLLGGLNISATYSSSNNGDQFRLNFKEHDLVADVNIGGSSTLDVDVTSDNELILEGGFQAMYYSKEYTLDKNKTYFVTGEYKTSEGATANIVRPQEWINIYSCQTSTGYTKFTEIFQAVEGNNQIGIQCTSENGGTFYFKNFYFGECRSVQKGVEIGALPTIPRKEGIDGKWKIGNEEITATTAFKWEEDKYADIAYDLPTYLNFKEHDLVADVNIGGSSTLDVDVTSDNELILEGGFQAMYYSKEYTLDKNKTYFVAGEYKTSEGATANIVRPQEWINIYSCQTSTGYTKFAEIFQAVEGNNQIGIQCTSVNGGTFYFKNFYFGECRLIEKGNKIGDLPVVPEREGYSGKWQIDNEDISGDTIFTWGESKYADIFYKKNVLHLNFNEYDLILDANIGGSSDLNVIVENNELKLTSPDNSKKTYYTKEYNLDSSKTYFVSGEYKTSTDSSGWFLFNNKWTIIKEFTPSTIYSKFYATFTPSENEQLIIQRSYPDDKSSLELTLKNLYFGECRELNKGEEIGELPNPSSSKAGYKVSGWEVDNEKITATTVFNWDDDKYANVLYEKENFKLAFTNKNFALSTDGFESNDKQIEFSSDGKTLSLNGKEATAAVFLSPTSCVKGHKYIISFDLKTDTTSNIVVGIDDKEEPEIITTEYLASPTKYTHYVFEFDAKFRKSETNVITPYIQFPEAAGTAYLENILLGDLDASETIDISFNSPISNLPPIPEGYTGKWMLNGKEINNDSIYDLPDSDVAYLDATAKELTISFKLTADSPENLHLYKIKYGQKLSDAITQLPEVPPMDGKVGKWQLNGKDVDLNTIVKENIVIVASYSDAPIPTPTPSDGPNIGLILGITIPCVVVVAGGTIAFILIKKKKSVNK